MGQTTRNKSSKINTQQALNNAIWSVCDILRRSNVASALQYVPELTWLLFLRILDETETEAVENAEAVGGSFTPSVEAPYRWQDWAAPDGIQRKSLGDQPPGEFFNFVNKNLIPHLKKLAVRQRSTPRQRVIGEIMSNVERVRVDTERNFLDILDKLHEISIQNIDDTHMFVLSQVYEGLLLRMGEKSNDGGQFFTPREVIRAMVKTIDPQLGETVYDPCCGTGGFLAQAYEYMYRSLSEEATGNDIETLKRRTFYGREKENLIYPIALANLVLHGIDEPHIWHGNTLTQQPIYAGLYQNVPENFDVILTNPPFGGKEGPEAQHDFDYRTSATQVLFLQHVINSLKSGGRCAIVLDEGVLFRTNETAFVQVKRKLLNECDIWAVVSLPGGVFSGAGAGVKTNIVFFTKGGQTEKIWYYDVSDVRVGKKTPFTIDKLQGFFDLLPTRGDSDRSWTVARSAIEARNFDLKAVNPNSRNNEDIRTPEELLDIIEAQGREVAVALAMLRGR